VNKKYLLNNIITVRLNYGFFAEIFDSIRQLSDTELVSSISKKTKYFIKR